MLQDHPRKRALDQLIRPTRAEISQSALRHNLRAVKALVAPSAVLAVVKANAYGHGAFAVARVLEDEGVDLLGVALVEEGLELRNAGVRAPVLVLGGSSAGGFELMVRHGLTPMLFRPEQVVEFARAARASGRVLPAHVKVDTGMSRLGVSREELPAFLELLAAHADAIRLDGFLSHLANADVQGDAFNAVQVERFAQACALVEARGFRPRHIHLANTAGTLAYPEARRSLVRLGIALYGVAPDAWLEGRLNLRPVLSWKTGISHLKWVEAGTAVSYGGTWVAPRRTRVATLPVGYADGYGRTFSNRAQLLVRGRRVPLVGRVTMDMSMCDVTDVPEAEVGDEVVLLGRQGQEAVGAQELARLSDTIPYEVLCSVGARVPRVLVD